MKRKRGNVRKKWRRPRTSRARIVGYLHYVGAHWEGDQIILRFKSGPLKY